MGTSKMLLDMGSGPRGRPGLSPNAWSWPHACPHLCVRPEEHVAPPGGLCPCRRTSVLRRLVGRGRWELSGLAVRSSGVAGLGGANSASAEALLGEGWGFGDLWAALTSPPLTSPLLFKRVLSDLRDLHLLPERFSQESGADVCVLLAT